VFRDCLLADSDLAGDLDLEHSDQEQRVVAVACIIGFRTDGFPIVDSRKQAVS
jgi:hypothetical protein